jgi:hypothetical protein
VLVFMEEVEQFLRVVRGLLAFHVSPQCKCE